MWQERSLDKIFINWENLTILCKTLCMISKAYIRVVLNFELNHITYFPNTVFIIRWGSTFLTLRIASYVSLGVLRLWSFGERFALGAIVGTTSWGLSGVKTYGSLFWGGFFYSRSHGFADLGFLTHVYGVHWVNGRVLFLVIADISRSFSTSLHNEIIY